MRKSRSYDKDQNKNVEDGMADLDISIIILMKIIEQNLSWPTQSINSQGEKRERRLSYGRNGNVSLCASQKQIYGTTDDL